MLLLRPYRIHVLYPKGVLRYIVSYGCEVPVVLPFAIQRKLWILGMLFGNNFSLYTRNKYTHPRQKEIFAANKILWKTVLVYVLTLCVFRSLRFNCGIVVAKTRGCVMHWIWCREVFRTRNSRERKKLRILRLIQRKVLCGQYEGFTI